MPGKQVPLRRANPRRSGRVRYAGFLAGLQGTVLPMELPGGLATIDPASPCTVPIYLAVRVQTPSSPYSSSSARQWSAGGVSSSGPGPNSDVYKLTVGLEICSAERLTYQFGNPTGSLDLHRSSLT